MCLRTALLFLLANVLSSHAEPRALLPKAVHLGVAGAPEWDEFAVDATPPARLDLEFTGEAHARDATLFVRQRDVKQEWIVAVNSRRVGKLFLMESDLIQTVVIPAGTLRAGNNMLSIFRAGAGLADDIVIEGVELDTREPTDVADFPALLVTVNDEEQNGLPCRITITDANGSLAAIWPAPQTAPRLQAMRPGVIYTGDGHASMALRPGNYTVVASRGFEYNAPRETVALSPGGTARNVSLRLTRQVKTPNLVACDTHIHTFTFSRHGDATIDERMLTLAGEGIELPIATDHDAHIDYRDAIRRTGMERWFTPVIGNEVTTRVGHFNIFPIDAGASVVDAKLTEWPALLSAMRKTSGVRVIVLNHPRSIHSGFRPFDPENFNAVTGENRKGLAFAFDAVEVLNSGAQQTDFMRVYRDWFALLNHGHRIVAVGASDSHDVSRFIVGQGRTYIAAADRDPSAINIEEACKNLHDGRASVSMGLLVTISVDDRFTMGDLAIGLKPEIAVKVEVRGPTWVNGPTHVALFANGAEIRAMDIANGTAAEAADGLKGRAVWRIPRPRHDVHLVAIATAPAVNEPFWAMTKPYQPLSTHWQGRAIGSTNPVWIDADGDGTFSSARAYAERCVAQHAADAKQLIAALADYDEAVAAQGASVCKEANIDTTAPGFVAELEGAVDHVKNGFAKFREAENR